jgi:hypothetical protein
MNILDVVRKLVSLILDLVPHEVASQLLSDEAIRRANAIADLAEAQKFPGGS